MTEAVRAIDEREYDKALKLLDEAVEKGDDLRSVYRLEGIAKMRLGEYEAAADAFRQALANSGSIVTDMDYDINLYLAECFKSLGRTKDAIGIYDNILALRKNDRETFYLRGVSELETADIEKAREDLDRAIAIKPRDFDMRVRVYQAYEKMNLSEDMGMSVLSDALNTYGDAMSDYEKGQLAFYLGNNADAQSYLERALKSARGEERLNVTLLLGQTGEKQGDYNFAITVYTNLLDESTSYPEIFNRRGICKMAQGNYVSAIADFQSGLNLGVSGVYQSLLRNEITAYEYSGDFEQARNKMNEYLTLYPGDAAAKREEIFLSTR